MLYVTYPSIVVPILEVTFVLVNFAEVKHTQTIPIVHVSGYVGI